MSSHDSESFVMSTSFRSIRNLMISSKEAVAFMKCIAFVMRSFL